MYCSSLVIIIMYCYVHRFRYTRLPSAISHLPICHCWLRHCCSEIFKTLYITFVNFGQQTVWNTELFDGDLLGITVIDGSKGFPIGWQTQSGSGERVYIRQGSQGRQSVPLLGVTYNDYQFVSNSHALSIAAFVSNGMLSIQVLMFFFDLWATVNFSKKVMLLQFQLVLWAIRPLKG